MRRRVVPELVLRDVVSAKGGRLASVRLGFDRRKRLGPHPLGLLLLRGMRVAAAKEKHSEEEAECQESGS